MKIFNETIQPLEHLENEKVALVKLEKLLEEGFTEYGIRFVNIREYEDILRTNSISGGVFCGEEKALSYNDYQHQSFAEYKDRGKKEKWSTIAANQTDWSQGTLKMEAYDFLIELLRQAKFEVSKDEQSEKGGKRDEVLIKFRDKILKKISNEPPYEDEHYWRHEFLGIASDYEGFLNYVKLQIEIIKDIIGEEDSNRLLNSDIGEESDVLAIIPDEKKRRACQSALWKHRSAKLRLELFKKEDIELANKWFKDPNSVNLRDFINVIVNNQVNDCAEQEEQYELALILSKDAIKISEEKSENGFVPYGWGYIKQGVSVKESLLGVICTLRGKEILQHVLELSNNAQTIPHPIFDHTGTVRYPANFKI